MSQIEHVHARQILDSRGNPTVEVELSVRSGAWGRAAVPSGASTGEFEATELRDGGSDWMGKGVTRAVENVNGEIATAVRGQDASSQAALDRMLITLDGTPNKSRLGANAILAVSLAAAHAAAAEERLPLWRYLGGESAHVLPVPMMNVVNGGAHADNSIDFQEFMIVPVGRSDVPRRRCAWPTRCSSTSSRCSTSAACRPRWGTRGASRPTSSRTRRPWRCWSKRSRRPATCPASRWRSRSTRPCPSCTATAPTCSSTRAGRSAPQELAAYWVDLAARYPIISIEDGMDEEDWDGWAHLTSELGSRMQLVGDDLFVTNTERLKRGIDCRRGELDPDQGQPDRNADRDARRDPHGARERLHRRHIAPLRRDRGRHDRRPGRGHRLRSDQDRRSVAHRSRGQVQPAAADRGGARRRRALPGPQRVPRASALQGSLQQEGARARRTKGAADAVSPSRNSASRRHSRTAPPRPRRVATWGLRARVRWDRVGRVSLLVVLCVVAGLYVQQGLAYLAVRSQANHQRAIVQQLSRSNASLRAQQRALNNPATILRDARALGMVRVGEHPYEVTGLPSH